MKTEDDVMDELKSANLIIPPEITITPILPMQRYDGNSSSVNSSHTHKESVRKRTSHSDRSKYNQLLNIIEEIGKDVRPTYTGSKSSTERLKRGIMHARVLVRECLTEVERSARQ